MGKKGSKPRKKKPSKAGSPGLDVDGPEEDETTDHGEPPGLGEKTQSGVSIVAAAAEERIEQASPCNVQVAAEKVAHPHENQVSQPTLLTGLKSLSTDLPTEYAARRAEVESRVQQYRIFQAFGLNPSSDEKERAFIERIRTVPTRAHELHPLIGEHETGLPPNTTPAPLTTVIPVMRDADKLLWIQWARLKRAFGEDMALAVKTAFIHATNPGQPNAGMSFGEIFRHGLAVYIFRHEGIKQQPPLKKLQYLMGTFGQVDVNNPILRCFLDPARIAGKLDELQVSVEVQESPFPAGKPGNQVFNIAIVFLLSRTMDVWHSGNRLSPGHRCHLQRLRQQLAIWKRQAPQIARYVERFEVPAVPKSAELLEEELEEQRIDEELSQLNFGDMLKNEKARCNSNLKVH